jgi:hypothetical protein
MHLSLYSVLELALLGVLVAHLYGMPQPIGKALAAGLFLVLLVLAILGQRA